MYPIDPGSSVLTVETNHNKLCRYWEAAAAAAAAATTAT
jgi:hypothetical protein